MNRLLLILTYYYHLKAPESAVELMNDLISIYQRKLNLATGDRVMFRLLTTREPTDNDIENEAFCLARKLVAIMSNLAKDSGLTSYANHPISKDTPTLDSYLDNYLLSMGVDFRNSLLNFIMRVFNA